ncbi:hypothetical protein CCP3SC15_4330002 [Gammaproteobacteria bacterium]
MQRKKKPDGLILRGGRWYIQKQVNYGEQREFLRESTGFSESERAEAEAYRDRRVLETLNALKNPEPIKPKERTFREAAVEYVISLERRGKGTERTEYALKSLDPYIGGMPLSHVHQGSLARYEAECRERGLSSATVARAYVVVSAVLNHAARVLRDGADPWLRTAVPRIAVPDWGDQRQPYRLTWDEQDRLLRALDKPDRQHLVAPVLFGLWTGARQAEITGLRWEWERKFDGFPRYSVWWVPSEVRRGSAKKTKGQQGGSYLIANAAARSVIEGQVSADSILVFPGTKGEMFRINNHGWRSAWMEAGLPVDVYVAKGGPPSPNGSLRPMPNTR